MKTYVQEFHSSDEECFDEEVDRGESARQTRTQTAAMHSQPAANSTVAVSSQNAQDSFNLGIGDGDSNQIIDEQTLEARLNAISQAHLAYSQQALKAVKDVCSEAIRQRENTMAQLQLENQRLKNSRPPDGSGNNSGGTGESPPTQGLYFSSRVSSPFKKPQVAWNIEHAPSVNVVECPHGDAVKLAHSSTSVESSRRVSVSSVETTQVAGGLQRSKSRTSIMESAKKARQTEPRKTVQENGQGMFIDAAAMKEKVKAAIMRPEYNVMNHYKKAGCWQLVARSAWFEHITLCVIAFNALWIAIDTDKNKAPTLIVAHPVFIVAENFFCIYFTVELLIRFMAFENKRNCLHDAWFVFDSCLVIMIVIDTWVMSAVLIITNKGSGAGLGDASILRLIRLLRLTRMARMARLLRAFPELMILVKGITVATRSVFFTLCLLAIIIYLFGVAFAQLSEDTPLEKLYFPTVPDAMNSLLLRGVFPDLTDFVNRVGRENIAFSILLLFFVLLSSLTVMNMLVGVLVEVVSVVSSVEKEQMTLQFVKSMILAMLENSGLDADGNCRIDRLEFESLLLKPEAARIIQEVGVDVVGLVDFADFIFKDDAELSFPELMEVVLQLRGSNTATVRDIVDLRKFIYAEIHSAAANISNTMSEKLEESVVLLQMQSSANNARNEVSNNEAPRLDHQSTMTFATDSGTTGAGKQIRSANVRLHGANRELSSSWPPSNGIKANIRGKVKFEGNQPAGGFSFLGLHRPSPALSNTQPLPEFPERMWMTELENDVTLQNDGGMQHEPRQMHRILQRRM